MLRLTDSVCIDASAAQVWAQLSELDSIHVWSEPIRRSYCVSPQTRGVDAVRVCELGRNVRITETMIEWEEGRSYTYIGSGVPFVKRAKNRWSVETRGNQSLLISTAEVEFKGGVFSRVLEPMMELLSKRTSRSTLASFKFLVEHGEPFRGDVKRHLPAPAGC